jgi:hypothetical protein
MTRSDEAALRAAVTDHLIVHPRIAQQGIAPAPHKRAELAAALPSFVPFAHNHYVAARAVLDWDHQIPSAASTLRLFLCYSEREARSFDAELQRREHEIQADNLYPEFDLPDYSTLSASETYVMVIRGGQFVAEELRFISEWRRRVDQAAQRAALTAVRRQESFQRSLHSRASEHLGPPVVIGWTPPCLARSSKWAVEIWLLTDFDGHRGRAHVFMVDSGSQAITREFFTDVMLS